MITNQSETTDDKEPIGGRDVVFRQMDFEFANKHSYAENFCDEDDALCRDVDPVWPNM